MKNDFPQLMYKGVYIPVEDYPNLTQILFNIFLLTDRDNRAKILQVNYTILKDGASNAKLTLGLTKIQISKWKSRSSVPETRNHNLKYYDLHSNLHSIEIHILYKEKNFDFFCYLCECDRIWSIFEMCKLD